jgi:hypothetical protein
MRQYYYGAVSQCYHNRPFPACAVCAPQAEEHMKVDPEAHWEELREMRGVGVWQGCKRRTK